MAAWEVHGGAGNTEGLLLAVLLGISWRRWAYVPGE